jgi:hypothetical protein
MEEVSFMRIALGAVVAAIGLASLSGAALAQTPGPAVAPSVASSIPSCPALGPAPNLPDGADVGVKAESMNKGQEAYKSWVATAQANLDCRKAEIEGYRKQLDAIKAQADVKVADYNATVQSVNTVSDKWRASGEAYNNRAGGKKKKG